MNKKLEQEHKYKIFLHVHYSILDHQCVKYYFPKMSRIEEKGWNIRCVLQQSDWVSLSLSLSGRGAGVFTAFPLNSSGGEVDGWRESQTHGTGKKQAERGS